MNVKDFLKIVNEEDLEEYEEEVTMITLTYGGYSGYGFDYDEALEELAWHFEDDNQEENKKSGYEKIGFWE